MREKPDAHGESCHELKQINPHCDSRNKTWNSSKKLSTLPRSRHTITALKAFSSQFKLAQQLSSVQLYLDILRIFDAVEIELVVVKEPGVADDRLVADTGSRRNGRTWARLLFVTLLKFEDD